MHLLPSRCKGCTVWSGRERCRRGSGFCFGPLPLPEVCCFLPGRENWESCCHASCPALQAVHEQALLKESPMGETEALKVERSNRETPDKGRPNKDWKLRSRPEDENKQGKEAELRKKNKLLCNNLEMTYLPISTSTIRVSGDGEDHREECREDLETEQV